MASGTARKRRSKALGVGLGALVVGAVSLVSVSANAADSEATELRQVVETALPKPDFAPSPAVGLRWDRDAQWSMLALTDPWQLRDDVTPLARGPLSGLGRQDLREDQWQATPYAASSLASAIAAVATRGIPLMRETRDYVTIRTHRLGCYFKGRGGGLIWRLEF